MTLQSLSAQLVAISRVPLCQFPTPLHPLPRLTKHLAGPEIWIKRDDMTGFGGGGNKGRKLEYLMAKAQQEGATHIITCGAQQSNHARQTAAAAAALGLPCLLLLLGGPDTQTGNQKLNRWLGAEMEFLGDIKWGELRRASEERRAAMEADGKRPYLIPVGGSTSLGALGFVRAACELLEQEAAFDTIYHASSSGSTQAGLAGGLALLGSKTKVVGVMVDLTRPPEAHLVELCDGVAHLLGLSRRFDATEFTCDKEHIGPGYAKPSEEGVEAIKMLARMEGIFLDPTYTGKAFAGMVADIRLGKIGSSERVLFWHTGGFPGLFAREFDSLP